MRSSRNCSARQASRRPQPQQERRRKSAKPRTNSATPSELSALARSRPRSRNPPLAPRVLSPRVHTSPWRPILRPALFLRLLPPRLHSISTSRHPPLSQLPIPHVLSQNGVWMRAARDLPALQNRASCTCWVQVRDACERVVCLFVLSSDDSLVLYFRLLFKVWYHMRCMFTVLR